MTNSTHQDAAPRSENAVGRRRIAQRVEDIPPSGIRKFFDLIAGQEGIISLGVGEPDFVTPWHIREAAIDSLERGHTHYTSNYGTPELRQGIVLLPGTPIRRAV